MSADEIRQVEVHPIKCPRCEVTARVKPSKKKCPECGYPLDRPSPAVMEDLKTLYREREFYNRALDRVIVQLEKGLHLPPSQRARTKDERERYASKLQEITALISELLLKQEQYKKWFDADGANPLPDWVHELTGGRPARSEEL